MRREAEKYMHAFPWCLGLAAAVTQLALKLFNPADWDCWIAPYPSDCTSSYQVKKGGTNLNETDCIRGDNAEIYQWSFFFAPLWAAIVYCIVAMAMIFRSVRDKERRSLRYSARRSQATLSGSAECRRAQAERTMLVQTEKVKAQCFMYAGAFFVVWTFPTIARLIQLLGGTIHPVIGVLAGTFIGIQGFLNAIIYFRPRYNMMATERPGRIERVWALVCSCLFFCCYGEDGSNGKGREDNAENDDTDYVSPPAGSSQTSDSSRTPMVPEEPFTEAGLKSQDADAAQDDFVRQHVAAPP